MASFYWDLPLYIKLFTLIDIIRTRFNQFIHWLAQNLVSRNIVSINKLIYMVCVLKVLIYGLVNFVFVFNILTIEHLKFIL